MLSVRSPSGAKTAMTTPSNSRSPVDHVSLRPVSPTMNSTSRVSTVPPMRPSSVLPGLIQDRSGVLPSDEPTTSAPMSLATTPRTMTKSVSVPTCPPAASTVLDHLVMSAANDPSTPIHTTPIVVAAMLGNGPDSTPAAPMNPMAPAMKANETTSGSPPSPIPYATSGAATQAARPGATAGR